MTTEARQQEGAVRARTRRSSRRAATVDTRTHLIRTGVEIFTERGFHSSGLDEVLRRANVPKGSFYHFFDSKQAFGEEVIMAYNEYLKRKLRRSLDDESMTPLARLQAFVEDAKLGMRKYDFQRGCLIGNLGQELGGVHPEFRSLLENVLQEWQAITAHCLELAVQAGELPSSSNPDELAQFFWIGWEGAILRAKLTQSCKPMDQFFHYFLKAVGAQPARKKSTCKIPSKQTKNPSIS